MVECEYDLMNCQYLSHIVLIDTWWNVNLIRSILYLTLIVVLIDTWWNVNKPLGNEIVDICGVLIDTWWNVNVVVMIL